MSESLVQENVSLESLVGRVADEFLRRQEQGERPDVEEYAVRYPEAAPVLRKVLAALALLEQSLSGAAAATAETPLTGILGDFRILGEVGRGGMGIVYEAVQVSLGRRVALKVLPFAAALDSRQLQRFRIEAQAAAHLHHQHIVPVYGVGCERGVHYYAMQYIEGHTLAALIRQLRRLAGLETADPSASAASASALASDLVSGRWAPAKSKGDEAVRSCAREQPTGPYPCTSPPHHLTTPPSLNVTAPTAVFSTDHSANSRAFFRTVAHLGVQAAEALEHAHTKGIIHRDIKPANLLIDTRGNLWITDFGLARMLSEAGLTMTGDLLGTLRYMSPEQALAKRAPLDHRTDIYSLGVTLYELLTLRPAYDGGDRQEILQQIAFEEPRLPRRLNKAIPAELAIIIGKAMGKSAAERYATAQELADDLQCFLEHKPIRAKKPTLLDWTRKWARRHQGAVATGIGGLIMAVGILTVSTLVTLSWYRTAVTNLYHARVGQARALRQARGTGYRSQALDLLKQAMALPTPEKNLTELRNEAVACMGDFVGLKPTTWDDFTADIRCMALQPNGAQVAMGLEDGNLLVRDRTTGDTVAELPGHRTAVVSLSFAADGKRMASADRDGKIQVWQMKAADAWDLQRTIAIDGPKISTHYLTPPTVAAALSPDGHHLAVCSSDQARVFLWSLADETPVVRLEARAGESLRCLAFSPDGGLLATGYYRARGHGISVWDVASRQLRPAVPSYFAVVHVVFSPDGHMLGAAFLGGAAFYDTATFQLRRSESTDCAFSVAFSPDSQVVAAPGRHAGAIVLWDMVRDRELARLQHPEHVEFVAWSTDGKALVAAAPRSVCIWNLAGAEEKLILRGHDGSMGLAFSPDGKLLASGGDLTVKIWDATNGKIVQHLTGFRETPGKLASSPDGCMLAAGEYGNGAVRIWDTRTWQELPVAAHPLGGEITKVAFSPDGGYFAACGRRGSNGGGGVMLWHLDGRRPVSASVAQLSVRDTPSLSFSSDSRFLAWLEEMPRCLRLWDLRNARLHPAPEQALPSGTQHALAFRDATQLVFTGRTVLPEIWDVAARKRVFAFESQEVAGSNRAFAAGHVFLSADGTWAAQSDLTPRIWDLDSRKLLLLLPKDRAFPGSLAWSPNKELLAAGLADGELVIWNFRIIKAELDKLGLGW
jgi:WD40 repeat protein/serine/threonine protein kinase